MKLNDSLTNKYIPNNISDIISLYTNYYNIIVDQLSNDDIENALVFWDAYHEGRATDLEFNTLQKYCKYNDKYIFHPSMKIIPTGTYIIGDNLEIGNDNENPSLSISVPSFQLMMVPVWQELYVSIIKYNPSEFKHKQHPVECINWYDAIRFCNTLSYLFGYEPCYCQTDDSCYRSNILWDKEANGFRLPTEIEWECAARGYDGRMFPWGNNAPNDITANYNQYTQDMTTSIIGSYPSGASPFGCLDMAGNVWEWCWSIYRDNLYNLLQKYNPSVILDIDIYSKHDTNCNNDINYLLQNDYPERVIKGGSYLNDSNHLRSAYRGHLFPNVNSPMLGFRLARNI